MSWGCVVPEMQELGREIATLVVALEFCPTSWMGDGLFLGDRPEMNGMTERFIVGQFPRPG
jgi:hypothetical protein